MWIIHKIKTNWKRSGHQQRNEKNWPANEQHTTLGIYVRMPITRPKTSHKKSKRWKTFIVFGIYWNWLNWSLKRMEEIIRGFEEEEGCY